MLSMYIEKYKLNYFIKNKFVIYFFIRLLLNNKSNLKKKYLFKFFLDTFFYSFFVNKIFSYNKNTKVNIISSELYLVDYYLIVDHCWSSINSSTFLKRSNYLFWHVFNNDALIHLFINITMKNGKKSISYKNVYKSLFFLKKLLGINPITFLKKTLSSNRFLFDIKYLTLKKKVIILPKLLSTKSQLVKSMKYMINNCSLKSFKIKNKTVSFYKKIMYLLLTNLFNKDRLKKLIKKDSMLVKNNFVSVKKEAFFSKYVTQFTSQLRKPLFKIKHVSINKKMKILSSRSRLIKKINRYIDLNQMFLLNRYKTNLQSKNKLRSKWF